LKKFCEGLFFVDVLPFEDLRSGLQDIISDSLGFYAIERCYISVLELNCSKIVLVFEANWMLEILIKVIKNQ
jgi:hypothetical protein